MCRFHPGIVKKNGMMSKCMQSAMIQLPWPRFYINTKKAKEIIAGQRLISQEYVLVSIFGIIFKVRIH